MNIFVTLAADLLKTLVPMLFTFLWNQSHAPTTIEEARSDVARRDRLLAAIRLRRSQSGDNPNHPAPPAR